MWLPGLGHVIAGRFRRAATWFAAALVLTVAGIIMLVNARLLSGLLIVVPITIVAMLAMWIDAYRCGHRSSNKMLGRPWKRYVLAIALFVAANYASPQVLLAYLIRHLWVEPFVTWSPAMSPTLQIGDEFFVHKAIDPQRWNIIVYDSPERPGERYVSRLAGLPGETVEIADGVVTINGERIPTPRGLRPFVGTPPPWSTARLQGVRGRPITLGPDDYYVLGDNSAASDSRYWGALPHANLVGVVTGIHWPPRRWHIFNQ
jgi:signal peptidase I